jgi:uncharacterized protein YjlB
LSASRDLLVVGAYPPGPERDLMRAGEPDKTLIRERLRRVPKPINDPLGGKDGPMVSLWGLQPSNA